VNKFFDYMGRELAAHGWSFTLILSQNKTRVYPLDDPKGDRAMVFDGIKYETLRAFLMGLEARESVTA